MSGREYVEGCMEREAERLSDQAEILTGPSMARRWEEEERSRVGGDIAGMQAIFTLRSPGWC